ncbi:MAG: hypothetical protein PQ964_01650 [Methanobacteriaceae archaeon]|jgi:hypothetical protein
MIDLGIQKGNISFEDEDYETIYLSDLEVGAEITGEIYISELKTKEFKGNEFQQFYLIIIDRENKQKWVCGINPSVYTNDDIVSVYGAKGGRVYQLIDSLNHSLNGTELEQLESYSVVFNTFRESINEKVEKVTVKAVQPSNPNAKTPNLSVVKAVEKP